MPYARKVLHHIEQQSRTTAKQITRFGGDDSTILHFHRSTVYTSLVFPFVGSHGNTSIARRDFRLIEQHLNLAHLTLVASPVSQFVGGIVVATDNLILRGLTAHIIIADAEPHHVHAHVSR